MSGDNFNERLDNLKKFIVSAAPGVPTDRLPSRYRRLASELGGHLVTRQEGTCCVVKTLFPAGSSLGEVYLEDEVPEAVVTGSAFSNREIDGETTLSSMLFFDIETTGLGGTGTVAFLVGCGSRVAEGFEVRQYLLPDYTDETALLEQVLTELGPDKTIVSYNGAAFDLSIVRDRMIINRVAREIKTAGHIDLLHTTRRLFKRRLGDCSLGNIERELFGFYREDDIPGYLIPSVYFDWLAGENLDNMKEVLKHNRLDILSLYFLVTQINNIFLTEGTDLDRVEDIYSLSRIYGKRKQVDKVINLYGLLKRDGNEALTGEMHFFHSLAMKRAGQWSSAVEIWQALAEADGREAFLANLELAKYYEHREKNLQKALYYTRSAITLGPHSIYLQNQLKRRLDRLSARLSG